MRSGVLLRLKRARCRLPLGCGGGPSRATSQAAKRFSGNTLERLPFTVRALRWRADSEFAASSMRPVSKNSARCCASAKSPN